MKISRTASLNLSVAFLAPASLQSEEDNRALIARATVRRNSVVAIDLAALANANLPEISRFTRSGQPRMRR